MALRVAVLLASLTVIFSWLWLRTRGATVVTVIAHGFVNAPLFFFEQVMRPSISGDAPAVRAISYCAALYAILALAV